MTPMLRMRVVAASFAALSAAPQRPTVLRNVAYVPEPHAEQHLDLYLPAGRGFATVLFVHGGSLEEAGERRSSSDYVGICRPFVAAGIACATTDYRLAPTFKWPTMPNDVAAAVKWLLDTLPGLGADPHRFFLFGHSSGCLLVAILATDSTYLGAYGLHLSDLAGVIPMGCTLNPVDTTDRGLAPDELRRRFARDPDDVRVYPSADALVAANPSRYLGPRVPPMLVVVADSERFMPPILEQGAQFVRRLLEVGVRADILLVPGRHMSSVERVGEGDATFAAIRRFIEPR